MMAVADQGAVGLGCSSIAVGGPKRSQERSKNTKRYWFPCKLSGILWQCTHILYFLTSKKKHLHLQSRLSHWQKSNLNATVTWTFDSVTQPIPQPDHVPWQRLPQMPLEATMLIIVKLEYMWNGNYHPTRFEAQAETKTDSNEESRERVWFYLW